MGEFARAKADKRRNLPNGLRMVSNSLKMDGKEWMASIVDEAITVMARQRKAITASQGKIERQKENLRSERTD